MNLALPPVLIQALRSRWFAGVVLTMLGALLYLTVLHLGGKAPIYQEFAMAQSSVSVPVPVFRLGAVFERDPSLLTPPSSKQESAFYTRHFGPAPAPPPPTTATFELTYLGYYSSSGGARQVMVQLGAGYIVAPVGARALSNLFVAGATMQELVLTNNTGQTNRLPLNARKPVEVPIK